MPEASEASGFRFMELPVEIRRMIWKECLPWRVVEIDGALWRRAIICNCTQTAKMNRKLPLIAQVCTESQAVVLENGHWEYTTGHHGTKAWLNPERDIVFQHWKDGDNLVTWGDYDNLAPELVKYDGRCRGLGVIAERIRSFYPSGNCDPDMTMQFTSWVCHETPQFRQRRDWWLSMDMVSLHVSNEVARRSGLFGLLGDAPVQLVDVHDTKRIAQFQEFAASAAPEDSELQGFFSRLGDFRERVRVWGDELELVWVYNDWYEAFMENFRGVLRPWDIWLGPIHKPRKNKPNKLRLRDLAVPDPNPIDIGTNIDLERFWLNRDHPFVRESLAQFPRFHLQIMFRHCPENCHTTYAMAGSHWRCCRGQTQRCGRLLYPDWYR